MKKLLTAVLFAIFLSTTYAKPTKINTGKSGYFEETINAIYDSVAKVLQKVEKGKLGVQAGDYIMVETAPFELPVHMTGDELPLFQANICKVLIDNGALKAKDYTKLTTFTQDYCSLPKVLGKSDAFFDTPCIISFKINEDFVAPAIFFYKWESATGLWSNTSGKSPSNSIITPYILPSPDSLIWTSLAYEQGYDWDERREVSKNRILNELFTIDALYFKKNDNGQGSTVWTCIFKEEH